MNCPVVRGQWTVGGTPCAADRLNNDWPRTTGRRLRTFFTSPVSCDDAQSRATQFMNLFDLTGEVAVVIGATGALGGAIAGGWAKGGGRGGFVGGNAGRGGAGVTDIKQAGGKAAFFLA